jgi:hypothetical protein
MFENELIETYPYNPNYGFSNFDPVVYSSEFVMDGVSGTLHDNGAGSIYMVSTGSNKEIVKKFLGSVNYENGTVTLSNAIFSSFSGNSIKIYARPANTNVKSLRDKILAIKAEDVRVNVELT